VADPGNTFKGRTSFDADVGNTLVAFLNRNVTAYPTEVGAPAFDLVPVQRQKDIMLNVARIHGQQEYDRIMQLVQVLQRQAEGIRRRLEITDLVHAARYDFQIYHGQIYWLCWDVKKQYSRLVTLGPDDWSTGAPGHWQYVGRVKWLGDYSWIEVDSQGQPMTDTPIDRNTP
jgi:hypothetical protein